MTRPGDSSLAQTLALLVDSHLGLGFAFVWGTLWGSFANVCVARIPKKMSVVRPGSKCFSCDAPVAWYDNIPILSWFILRGKCRRCGAAFSIRYALVELAAGILAAAVWQITVVSGVVGDVPGMQLARFLIEVSFVLVMLVLAFIDLDTKLLPDVITLPSIIIFYLAGLALPERRWYDGVIGIAVGYGFVRLVADGYYYLTKREGLGYGDGKLLAVVGALFGWRAIPFAVFVGSLLGTLITLPILVAARRKSAPEGGPALRHVEIPFGPFLVLGALTWLFAGDLVTAGWLRLLS